MNAQAVRLRYLDELWDLWNLEDRGATLLPRMARAASQAELAGALRALAWVTLEQRRRVEKMLLELDVKPEAPRPSSAAGVFAMVEAELRNGASSDGRDLVLIGLAQRLAHLGQAAYGAARTLAEKLGYRHHAAELQRSLEEDTEVEFRLIRFALFDLSVDDLRSLAPTIGLPPPPDEVAGASPAEEQRPVA